MLQPPTLTKLAIGEVITAKRLNDLIDQVNRAININVADGMYAQRTPDGLTIGVRTQTTIAIVPARFYRYIEDGDGPALGDVAGLYPSLTNTFWIRRLRNPGVYTLGEEYDEDKCFDPQLCVARNNAAANLTDCHPQHNENEIIFIFQVNSYWYTLDTYTPLLYGTGG